MVLSSNVLLVKVCACFSNTKVSLVLVSEGIIALVAAVIDGALMVNAPVPVPKTNLLVPTKEAPVIVKLAVILPAPEISPALVMPVLFTSRPPAVINSPPEWTVNAPAE